MPTLIPYRGRFNALYGYKICLNPSMTFEGEIVLCITPLEIMPNLMLYRGRCMYVKKCQQKSDAIQCNRLNIFELMI